MRSRKRLHQITWVGLLAKPPQVILWSEDQRHPIVDFSHQLVCIGRDHRKRPDPLAGPRLFPVLPNPTDAERFTGLHRNGIRLLGLLPLDRLPLEKAVHRHDAAPLAVGVSERREPVNGLALGVDWLAASGWVLAPIRNQAPAQWIEREFAGRMIPPDDQQLLARGGIPAWRIVVQAAVAHIKAIYDGIPKRSAALDDSPAHDDDISIVRPRSRPSPVRRFSYQRQDYDGWTIGRSGGHQAADLADRAHRDYFQGGHREPLHVFHFPSAESALDRFWQPLDGFRL